MGGGTLAAVDAVSDAGEGTPGPRAVEVVEATDATGGRPPSPIPYDDSRE